MTAKRAQCKKCLSDGSFVGIGNTLYKSDTDADVLAEKLGSQS